MASRQVAIRQNCLDCCDDDSTAIRCCPTDGCSLWDFRMGYRTRRNELYYNREFFRRHKDVPQEEFNRILKKLQKQAEETV